MTPDQFLTQIRKQPAPVYLFLGPDGFQRNRCRKALLERVLPTGDVENGFTRHDLDDIYLDEVIDDARSLSLFASERLIWVSGAESALPRGRAAAAEDDDDSPGGKESSGTALAAYVKDPSPGTVLIFDSNRYDFDGEDKTKQERVRKFYSAIPNAVEFPHYTPQEARTLAQSLAREAKLKLGADEVELLIEALGADASRIATEIEKLSLYAGGRAITTDELASLIPNARATTIFALVNALARKDRMTSLGLLDTLVREGEYLPLALTFLGTQFRLALVAREAGLRNAYDIQGYFTKMGTPMWRQRAEQVQQTMSSFSKPKLEKAIARVFAADRALRDTRPDDRIVMEEFVLGLTD
ncbi:MAG: DNA polymerase III subunit delta [Bryobacteraceae bacterium]